MRDLDIRRLERIETELLRLEDEQLEAKIYADQQQDKVSPKERAHLSFYEHALPSFTSVRRNLNNAFAAAAKHRPS